VSPNLRSGRQSRQEAAERVLAEPAWERCLQWRVCRKEFVGEVGRCLVAAKRRIVAVCLRVCVARGKGGSVCSAGQGVHTTIVGEEEGGRRMSRRHAKKKARLAARCQGECHRRAGRAAGGNSACEARHQQAQKAGSASSENQWHINLGEAVVCGGPHVEGTGMNCNGGGGVSWR